MAANPDLLAPCGLYCGVCAVYQATRDDNLKLKEILAGVYRGRLPDSDHITAEQINCGGCLSGRTWGHCSNCQVRACALGKGFAGCHQCGDWPCALIADFPMAIAKKIMLRSVPHRREAGDERWAHDEEARYRCPACAQALTRGAPRCHKCGAAVDLD